MRELFHFFSRTIRKKIEEGRKPKTLPGFVVFVTRIEDTEVAHKKEDYKYEENCESSTAKKKKNATYTKKPRKVPPTKNIRK